MTFRERELEKCIVTLLNCIEEARGLEKANWDDIDVEVRKAKKLLGEGK